MRKRKKYSGVRQRGHDSYEINYYANGKRVSETVKASTEAEAYAYKLKRIFDADATLPTQKAVVQISFEQAIEKYLINTEKLLHSNTRQRSLCIYKHLRNYLKHFHPEVEFIHQITSDIVKRYKDYLLSIPTKSPSGINTDISKLRAIFKKFIEIGFLEKNPFYAVEKIPQRLAKPQKKHLPTDYEIKQILECTAKDSSYREITRFLIRVGRRIEETSLYEKKDVLKDSAGKPIKILVRPEISKTKEPGEIPLDGELAEIVNEALTKHVDTQFLFTNKERRKISQNTYRNYLQDICKAKELNKITPHCFRYFVANKLLNSGINLKDAMAITGHLDLQSFMSYIKTTEEGKQKALAVTRLDNIFA